MPNRCNFGLQRVKAMVQTPMPHAAAVEDAKARSILSESSGRDVSA
eukprot:CAMPEP_0119316886 /NCGR_PEP_ID=MMETSP1333-20130426/41249_1 /TAXON_ID=418940 /ORGANISM="Scyphosphaera apsteinii, Strain RCC1455" /LENGTH=45 /DNA_ID= /DNA_START= /DNA_END= /DNA_ORIENTATION=